MSDIKRVVLKNVILSVPCRVIFEVGSDGALYVEKQDGRVSGVWYAAKEGEMVEELAFD